MTGMKPKDAIKMNHNPLVNRENYLPETTLPQDGLYRYLLQPAEEHNFFVKSFSIKHQFSEYWTPT